MKISEEISSSSSGWKSRLRRKPAWSKQQRSIGRQPLPESQKPSALLPQLHYKQTVSVILPLLSAYHSTGSDSHSHHRCFLWSSIDVFKDDDRAFRIYAVNGETCGSERRKPRSGLLSRSSVGATRPRAALNNQPRTLKTMKRKGEVSSLRRVFPVVLPQWKSNGVNVRWGGCHSRPARLVQLGMARAFGNLTFHP
jgi:hypothetical protein